MVPLIRAAHIQPALGVTFMTTALAVFAGRGASSAWVFLAMLSGQLFVGWSNDWLDAARDAAAGRSDKPVAAGALPRRLAGLAALGALLLCVPLSLANGLLPGVVHLGAVASAGLYNLVLKRTPLSPLPYVVSFGSLPYFVTFGLPGRPAPAWWAPLAAALLGAGAHFVNTLPDQDDDRRLGVNGVPQRLGRTPSLVAGTLLLGAAGLVLALLPPGPPTPLALGAFVAQLGAVAGVATAARLGHPRTAWTLTIAAAVLAVVLLLAQAADLT